MKALFFACGFFLVATALSVAQSRVSVAPTYWYAYGKYSYQTHSLYDGSNAQLSGHTIASSVGLTARYHFKPKWDLSVGLLYNSNSSHLKTPQSDDIQLTSRYIQLPILVNYRLSDRPLSAYISAGAFLSKSKTFSDEPVKSNALIGVGLDYRLNSKLSLLLQPTASYLLYKPASNTLFQYNNYNSYSFGLQTQLIWHL